MKFNFHCSPLPRRAGVRELLCVVLRSTLMLVLLCSFSVSVFARQNTSYVSMNMQNASLESIFKTIKKQTGYLVFYKDNINPATLKQDVNLQHVALEDALTVCLKNFSLTYTIVNKTIVISLPPATRVAAAEVPMQEGPITGKIIDSLTRESLIAVTIVVKGKNIFAQTNESGAFKIDAAVGDVLQVSYLGYKKKEIVIKNKAALTILLAPTSSALSDVVITGYQQIKKDNYTGNAIVVKGDELKRLNSQNILKGLASFDPSMRISENNILGSDPNAMPKINVRGSTSLPAMNGEVLDRNNLSSNYNLPVFIMDGFEVSLQKVVDFDINRIASVTILKDAAATAVYGSRAANGVIVITTKAPTPGKLRLTYNGEMRMTAADLSDYSVLNAADKLEYERLAGLYSGVNNSANTVDELTAQYYAKLKNVVSGVNTYWLSQPLRNAYGQKHTIYAEGGDTTFRYGIDLRYQTNPGVMKTSYRDQYSGGMSFSYNPSRRLVIKNELTLTAVNQQNSKYGSFSTYVSMNPYYPIYGPDGKLIQEIANWRVDTYKDGPDQIKNVPVYNPLYEASLGNFDKSKYTELLDAFSADWKINNDLRLIGLISYNNTKTTNDVFVSPYSSAFINTPTEEILNRGSYTFNFTNYTRFDGNARLVYNKTLGGHAINAVLGANYVSTKMDYKGFQARGFSNDKFSSLAFARIYTPNSAPNADITQNRLLGSFFNGSYSYKNRYLVDASFRMDGSSTFGTKNRTAPFWSTGFGWNAHNEEFIRAILPNVSRLKFTATTGLVGSVDFPPYLSRTTYSYQTANWYSTGIGAIVNGYGNSALAWQKTQNYDFRMELGLFNDRIVITPVYYHKLTKGLLTDINVAPSTGYTTYKENLGDMANNGYELYLSANLYKSKDLNVNFTGNYAYNENKIVKISNALKKYNESVNDYQLNEDNKAQGVPLLRYQEGQSINTIYAVKSMGIDPQNGREIYVMRDGKLTYNYYISETQPVGNMTPKGEGFVGTNVTYKQWMLSLSAHYKFGGDWYNQTLVDRVENADPRFNVDSRALAMRWIQAGDKALYKNIADLNTTYASSRFIQKDNLFELQSVYLSYDVKREVARRWGLQSLRGAIQGNDIFRIASIKQERGISYPFARSLTVSLLATF